MDENAFGRLAGVRRAGWHKGRQQGGEQPVTKDEADRIVRASPDGRIRFYEYKGGNHNAAWDKGLTEPDLVEWFFGKSLAPKKP